MKRILILLLLLISSSAWGAEAVNTAVGVADSSIKTIVGVATASAKTLCGVDYDDGDAVAGTWYIYPSSYADTCTDQTQSYAIGSAPTIGAGTHITKIAAKVASKGSATSCHIALYTNEATATRLASGTCTPEDNTWCIAEVDYTGTASTAYIVAYGCDANTTTTCDEDGAKGAYASHDAAFPDTTEDFTLNYSKTWAVAICAGGTCSGNPD